jgi:hypothetical protein
MMDEEVRKLIESAYQRAKSILSENKQSLETVAKVLLEKEVILQEDVLRILGPRKVAAPIQPLFEKEQQQQQQQQQQQGGASSSTQ